MYVFLSENFKDNLRKIENIFNLESVVSKFEDLDSLVRARSVFDPIPPYWKKRVGSYRIIAKYLEYKSENVFALLDILDHDDYDRFSDDPRAYGAEKLEKLIEKDVIQKELQKREKNRQSSKEFEKGFIRENQRPWLKRPDWKFSYEIPNSYTILESDEWGRRIRKQDSFYWLNYYFLILDCLKDDCTKVCTEYNSNVFKASNQNYSILYSKFKIKNEGDLYSRNVLFLIAPFNHPITNNDIISFFKTSPIGEIYSDRTSDVISSDDITVYCAKSYPDIILGDDTAWLNIEKEEGVNFALSIEEESLLHAISTGEKKLPVFINGRAGSGKSTMLYYLFADYCERKQEHNLEESPLFITYSPKLLDTARESVKTILRSHHKYFIKGNLEKNCYSDIDNYFLTFDDLLFSFLSDKDIEKFSRDKYISFNRFNKLYCNQDLSEQDHNYGCRLGQKNWPSEFCWHIIRSYIKGYNCDSYLEYSDLQKKDRDSIKPEDFKGIYDSIFMTWYKRLNTEHGLWDDQDLIRHILTETNFADKDLYPVIFCDESQDFTRIELQLINRIFLFSNVKLYSQDIEALPMAFAGDPLQTLQPTGFRWESTTSVFYDEIVKTLDPNSSLKLSISYIDLDMNYRSTAPITQFANYIQYLRKTLFNLDKVKPQINYKRRDAFEPKIFIIGENITFDNLKDLIEDTTIIVPCDKDRELEFISNDDLLQRLIKIDADGDPPKSVLSAVNAKGLEFPRVIVYKFGNELESDVKNIPNRRNYEKLKYEYFFNKLYVAISRAMSKLFIIDTNEGEQKLWRYTTDQDYFNELKGITSRDDGWDVKHIGFLAKGSIQDANQMKEDDPLAIAEEYKRKGDRLGDPSLLRRAKQYYSGLGDEGEASLCEALALKYESKTKEAGDKFSALKKYDDAFGCYWSGMHWNEMRKIQNEYGAVDKKCKMTIAEFMLSPNDDKHSLLDFKEFLNNLPQNREMLRTDQAKKAISIFCNRLKELKENNKFDFDENQWSSFGEALLPLTRKGFRKYTKLAGFCFYWGYDHLAAIKVWEDIQDTIIDWKEYCIAKAKTSKTTADRLFYLEKAKLYEEIVKEWEKDSSTIATDLKSREFVATALEHLERYHDAFLNYLQVPNNEKFIAKAVNIFSKLEKSLTDIERSENLVKLFNSMIHSNRWEMTIETIEKLKADHSQIISEIGFDIVREIAYSELTSEKINIAIRKQFDEFINIVLSSQDWEKHLSLEQAGAALERIGEYASALKFYEKYLNDENRERRTFSKRRWIVTKNRQYNYADKQPQQKDRAIQIKAEIRRKMYDWNFGPVEKFLKDMPEYPELEYRDIEYPIGGQLIRSPEEIILHILNIEIRIKKMLKLVMIMDMNDYKQVRIDAVNRKVLNADEEHKEEDEKIYFSSLSSGYEGKMHYLDNRTIIEVNLEGVATPVRITL